jgi:predicted RNA-binding Zn-ribbon protein involved in translation (DUF1610 family)
MSDDRVLDGNGRAGMLAQLLAVDPTTVQRRCQACGDEHVLGAHRAYEGAAVVFRCPGCDAVAVRIAERDDGVTVEWRGVYRVPAAG